MNHNRFWLVFVRNWDLFNVFNRFQWPAFINEWFVKNLHWRCLIDIVYATKSNGNSLAIIKVHCKATTLHWMESIQYCYRVLRWAGKPTKKKRVLLIKLDESLDMVNENLLDEWLVDGFWSDSEPSGRWVHGQQCWFNISKRFTSNFDDRSITFRSKRHSSN